MTPAVAEAAPVTSEIPVIPPLAETAREGPGSSDTDAAPQTTALEWKRQKGDNDLGGGEWWEARSSAKKSADSFVIDEADDGPGFVIGNSDDELIPVGTNVGVFATLDEAKAACQRIEDAHAAKAGAIQAAEAPAEPATEAACKEPADPPRTEPAAHAIDPEAWQEIVKARADEFEAASEVSSLSEELKQAKKRFESASERLGRLIDEAENNDQPGLPFPRPGNNGHAKPAEKAGTAAEALKQGLDAAAAETGNAWRFVKLEELEPKIKDSKLKILAEHEPPILTLGELCDWQAAKGDFWAKDLKGLGDKGREQIIAAADRYWADHPQGKLTDSGPGEMSAPPATPSEIDPDREVPAPKTIHFPKELGLKPGEVEAACNPSLLVGGDVHEVKTIVEVKGFGPHVVTPAPAGFASDVYALRPLHSKATKEPPEAVDADDTYARREIRHKGETYWIGEWMDCRLVRDGEPDAVPLTALDRIEKGKLANKKSKGKKAKKGGRS